MQHDGFYDRNPNCAMEKPVTQREDILDADYPSVGCSLRWDELRVEAPCREKWLQLGLIIAFYLLYFALDTSSENPWKVETRCEAI